jgi:hypothetical protein
MVNHPITDLASLQEALTANRIPFEVDEDGRIIVHGFSESDTCSFEFINDLVIALTRHDTRTDIEEFRDIALLAFDWFCDYVDIDPFKEPHEIWKPIFLDQGWIEIELVEKIVIKG